MREKCGKSQAKKAFHPPRVYRTPEDRLFVSDEETPGEVGERQIEGSKPNGWKHDGQAEAFLMEQHRPTLHRARKPPYMLCSLGEQRLSEVLCASVEMLGRLERCASSAICRAT